VELDRIATATLKIYRDNIRYKNKKSRRHALRCARFSTVIWQIVAITELNHVVYRPVWDGGFATAIPRQLYWQPG